MFISRKHRKDAIYQSQNVVASIGGAKSLHKELIRVAHPDKNPDKIELAKELSELINENRFNYQELLRLKERVEKEL